MVTEDKFDLLLKAMAAGAPPTARTKPAAGPASGEAPDACSSDTRTLPDTSGDVSGEITSRPRLRSSPGQPLLDASIGGLPLAGVLGDSGGEISHASCAAAIDP